MTEDEMREALATAMRAAAVESHETPCDDGAPEDCPSCSAPIQLFSAISGVPSAVFGEVADFADALLPVVRHIAAEELRAAALEYEADGAIISALSDQARSRSDLAGEAACAITASDFDHIAGRLRARAHILDPATTT